MKNINDIKNFFSGDNLDFYIKSLYNNNYECIVVFSGETKHKFSGTYLNNQFEFKLTSQQTSQIKAGFYKIYISYQKQDDRITNIIHTVEVKHNIIDNECTSDIDLDRKILSIINAKLENRLTEDYSSYTIGDKSITKLNLVELHDLKLQYEDRVARKEASMSGKNINKINILWTGKYGHYQ